MAGREFLSLRSAAIHEFTPNDIKTRNNQNATCFFSALMTAFAGRCHISLSAK
jgi:hypothetical protein